MELAAAGAGTDTDLLTAAHALMTLADPAGSRAGKYTVTVTGSRGVQIGDGNTQHNIGTYIHTQVVRPPGPAAKPSGRTRQPSVDSRTRLEAAAAVTNLNAGMGPYAYKAIAEDSKVDIGIRLQAAAAVTNLNPGMGPYAYRAIAEDSKVDIATRLEAAAAVTNLNPGMGPYAYRAIAEDKHRKRS